MIFGIGKKDKNKIYIYEQLKKYYGYDSFRRGQYEVVENIVNGKDVLAVMATGSGKSLCYILPSLMAEGITLVISPLLALAKNQVDILVSMGIKAAYINSLLTERQIDIVFENSKKGMYKIIYVSPERLLTKRFIDFASNVNIYMVAVDEAHCISQWGNDFRPSYAKISDFIKKLPKRPIVSAFTATADKSVKNDIIKSLKLKKPFVITAGFNRKNLFFSVYKPIDKKQFIINYLRKNPDKSGIIYCTTRKNTEELCDFINRNGCFAAAYHAGMDSETRKNNQNDFICGKTKVIVATNAFGMGLDKTDVRFVINYNIPANIEEYYQEAGRAGRDGKYAECILLYHYKDVRIIKRFIKRSNSQDKKYIKNEYEKLRIMEQYALSDKVCQRKKLLGYFGEKLIDVCDNCGVCCGNVLGKYYRDRAD